jgi:molybdenum cofactor guanylyltransferase
MGTDKSLMLFKGKPLIQYAIDTVAPLCDRILISSRSNNYDFTGCEVCYDERPEQAPIIGIYSCLKHSQSELNIILSCDMPFVVPSLFEYLLTFSTIGNVTIPLHGNNYLEPLCGVYNKTSISSLDKFITDKNLKLQDWLKNIPHNEVRIDENLDFYNSGMFTNLNYRSDFEQFSK